MFDDAALAIGVAGLQERPATPSDFDADAGK